MPVGVSRPARSFVSGSRSSQRLPESFTGRWDAVRRGAQCRDVQLAHAEHALHRALGPLELDGHRITDKGVFRRAPDFVRICAGTTKRGEPCRSRVVNRSGLCIAHDPASRELAQQARRKGGRAKADSYLEAHRSWVERRHRDILRVYEEALAANKVHRPAHRPGPRHWPARPRHPHARRGQRPRPRFGRPSTKMEIGGGLALAALMADGPQAITDTDY